MIIDKKFWIDENSTPPINYIWLKEGKAWEYNKNLNKWKVLDTLNAENFIQVFNSSTEEEKNAIKEALGISGGEGQSSEDSDVVRFSDYCLFTVDPDVPTVTERTESISFYPNETADKILPLACSGSTYIIENGTPIILSKRFLPSQDDPLIISDDAGISVFVIGQEDLSSAAEVYPSLNITGPGYLLRKNADTGPE